MIPDTRMATITFHCQAHLHPLCPVGDEVMVCICPCHQGKEDVVKD